MFQHLDILYRTGSLALVWHVGNQAVKWDKANSKVGFSIQRADIIQLCELVRAQLAVPRSVTVTAQRKLSLGNLTVLLVGLSRMHLVQVKAFLKRLEEILQKYRFKMPETFDMYIDQPAPVREVSHTISVNYEGAPCGFGRFEFDTFLEPLAAAARRSVTPVPSSNESILPPVNVAAALRQSKKSRKHDRSHREDLITDDEELNDDEVLRMLESSASTVRLEAITMLDVDPPAPVPIEFENPEHYRFGDFDDQPQNGEPVLNNYVEPEQPMDLDAPESVIVAADPLPRDEAMEIVANDTIAEAEAGIPLPSPVLPQPSPIYLTQRIENGRSSSSSNPEEPRRKRRRRTGLAIDEINHFTTDEMRAQLLEARQESQDLREARASTKIQIPRKNRIPTPKTNAAMIKEICGRFGREMGRSLTNFVVAWQDGNESIEVGRRRRSAQEDPLASTLREQVSANEERSAGLLTPSRRSSVAGIAGVSAAEEAPLPILMRSDTTEEVEGPPGNDGAPVLENQIEPVFGNDYELNPQNEDQGFEYQQNEGEVTIAEQIASPARADHVFAVPVVPPLRTRAGSESSEQPAGKEFSLLFPPATTSRAKAAQEFFRCLKLQKERKVLMNQPQFLGPLYVQALRAHNANEIGPEP